jgi:MFS family permease
VWGYLKLEELSERHHASIDIWGNVTFALGLVLVMIGLTYGIEPYHGHSMGWGSPAVISELASGVALLVAFCYIEVNVAEPMFRLQLFKIRAFTAGVLASFLAALSRGGLMFTLIIWLQGIWLPQHGVNFADTPLKAGLAMLPLTFGLFIAGPLSGVLSDRFGARPFATGGMIGTAIFFGVLELLPINFSYPEFAVLLFLLGLTMASFGSPNRAAVMNALPARHRGAGSGMNSTFQNSAQVLSIGMFFTLMIVGFSASLPETLNNGLTQQGVPAAVAAHVSHLPPVATLFAAFLGYNPIQHLVGSNVLHGLSAHQQAVLTSRNFFPSMISGPFKTGLHAALDLAIAMSLLAAAASWVRGGKYHYVEPDEVATLSLDAVEAA